MIKKIFFIAVLFNLISFNAFAEEKRYLMNIRLMISDNVKKVVANYKLTRIITKGKSVTMNLRVSNMHISLICALLSGDETSVNLISFGKVSLKKLVSDSLPAGQQPLSDDLSLPPDSANMPDLVSSQENPYAVVASIPEKTFSLKFGEKLLFFPLGVKDNGKNGKISNCILEIEILPYDEIGKKLTEESDLLESSKQQQMEKIDS